MEEKCELVPFIEYEDDEEVSYSDSEFYCMTCGEFVEGPCED